MKFINWERKGNFNIANCYIIYDIVYGVKNIYNSRRHLEHIRNTGNRARYNVILDNYTYFSSFTNNNNNNSNSISLYTDTGSNQLIT